MAKIARLDPYYVYTKNVRERGKVGRKITEKAQHTHKVCEHFEVIFRSRLPAQGRLPIRT